MIFGFFQMLQDKISSQQQVTAGTHSTLLCINIQVRGFPDNTEPVSLHGSFSDLYVYSNLVVSHQCDLIGWHINKLPL